MEASDFGDNEGIVNIIHHRIVELTCTGCGGSRKTDDFNTADRWISSHNQRCRPV